MDNVWDGHIAELDEHPGRSYPDDREPTPLQLSFVEFTKKARQLFIDLQDTTDPNQERVAAKDFYRFVLAGRIYVDDLERHVTLNSCQGQDSNVQYTLTRDYDSLIGISKDLPYSKHIELLPIPPFRMTLTQSNHLTGTVFVEVNQVFFVSFMCLHSILKGREHKVAMHHIPNFAFGRITNRSIIRVFFPRMYRPQESRSIPSQHFQLIYDSCLRPLVEKHMTTMSSHWPVSYDAAFVLYQDSNNHIREGSLDVPQVVLNAFGPEYLQTLSRLHPDFRDAYFVHELRGWKGATVHDPSHQLDRHLAWQQFTQCLHLDKIQPADWFVDVGLELGRPQYVTTWRDSGHADLLAHCLPSIEEHQIDSLCRSRSFFLDPIMHLGDLTGFRCSPHAKGKQDRINYIQAYTTEKSHSYQLHKGLFTSIEAKIILTTQGLQQTKDKIEKMGEVVHCCTGEIEHIVNPQSGCARLEVRIQLSEAQTTLLTFPQDLIEHCLISLPCKYWWYVRL